MTETDKLQKAVETTIQAGYQLNSEAFAYLTQIAQTEDPTEIVNRALTQIEELEEKPFFIEKAFLEELYEETQNQTQQTQPQPQEPTQQTETQTTPEATPYYEPYAKTIQPQIKIIDDPTKKLSSNGTIEDYIHYFQDRFKRLEKLLRQRIDVKAAIPIIEALKSPPRTRLKIICMISEKRESKQQTLLTVEDLQATATVLITRNATEELRKKAQALILDQVACIQVMKTRTKLLIAEDIIQPEIGTKPQHRATEPIYAVLTSDIHAGSNKFNKEAFKKFIQWLQGKHGNDQTRDIASHVKYLLIAGDIIDGIGIYPNQIKELTIRDVHRQYEYASSLLARIPEHIEVIISPGNHDAPRKSLPQPAIAEELFKTLKQKRTIHNLGDPTTLSIHGIEVLMYHGRSLDDIIGTIPGIDHNHPEKAMKLLLQTRHLAPLYGGKTQIIPENRDFLTIEHPPDIFHAGHIHVLGYCNYKGILVVNSGGWQEQTDYMQKLGLMPTPGKVPVINLQTLETTILSFA